MPEYPKYLHHPSYAPADLDVMGQGVERPKGVAATRYPPVVVHNADQEAEYVQRRGYSPGAYSQPAIDQMRIAPKPNGYREQQYPMYGPDGAVIEDPNAPEPGIDPREYPKYVGDVIVNSPEEERQATIDAGLPDPVRAEYEALVKRAEELKAKLGLADQPGASTAAAVRLLQQFAPAVSPPAAAAASKASPRRRGLTRVPRKPPVTFRNSPEQIELLALCTEAGLKVDNRYGIARLREMLEEATAPTPPSLPHSLLEEPSDAQQDS